MSETVRVGWSQVEIDAALSAAKDRRDAAKAAGELAEVARHETWIDRLLDARPHHRASPHG